MRVPLLFANPGIRTGRFFQLDEAILSDLLVDGSISEHDPASTLASVIGAIVAQGQLETYKKYSDEVLLVISIGTKSGEHG